MGTQETYADKINKLIAKAESTTPEEAELLLAKAQELMTKYAIDQALLDETRGVERDEIIQHRFEFGGYYAADRGALAFTVLSANGCRAVYHRSGQYTGARTIGDKSYKMWYVLEGIGFQSDIDRAVMLDASLQIQMARALNQWWKTEDRSWMSKTENVRARQSFMAGFADGVGRKLREATEAGRKAAEKERAAKTSEQEAKDAVALVLRSRKDRVDDWMDEHYGRLRSGRGSYRTQDYNARGAGTSAGSRADVGQGSVKGRRGLNR